MKKMKKHSSFHCTLNMKNIRGCGNMSMDEVFNALKLSAREKKFLNYLLKHKHSTSLEIQQETAIPQPGVSMAAKSLKKRGYIKSELITRTTKPNKQIQRYSLTEDLNKLMFNDLKAKIYKMLAKSDAYIVLYEELTAMIKLNKKGDVTT